MTHVSWGKIANRLAQNYHVVATDLRGYGDSSAPEPDATCSNYSFRAMANDQVEVMRQLGHDRFFVAGHDRGARVAHRMALDHPEKVRKVALIDILPTLHIWENTSRKWALDSWHWSMMPLDNGLPELMMAPFRRGLHREKDLKEGDRGVDLRPRSAGGVCPLLQRQDHQGLMCRLSGGGTVDLDLDRADRDRGRMIACPVLLLWGARSHTEGVFTDVIGIWRKFATDIVGEGLDAGHYVNEHRPDETLGWFRRSSFDRAQGARAIGLQRKW